MEDAPNVRPIKAPRKSKLKKETQPIVPVKINEPTVPIRLANEAVSIPQLVNAPVFPVSLAQLADMSPSF